VQLDDELALGRYLQRNVGALPLVDDPDERTLDRRYITVNAKRRMHQVAFRERVLAAYETTCALCRLRHGALLDAAHIIPDGEPDGEPEVSNGLSLCKIHHAAYDLNYLGITPKYKVEVRAELLQEMDGPMLQHGLKAMHGTSIVVPRARSVRPSEHRLENRFQRFLEASGKAL
jgi:putative restriction endonuclease